MKPEKRAYVKVNQQFGDTIDPHLQDGDKIWIHDYHLLLLPRYFRDRLGNKKIVRIELSLHTPFPSEDMFNMMPLHEAI